MRLIKRNKPLFGVGINDADYNVYTTGKVNGKHRYTWICPYYKKWKLMLERCYYTKFKEKRPTYEECTCCPEWLYFSNFKAWMETQDWEGKQLDKDLLIRGNKIYSPETCVFVSPEVNRFILESTATRGKYLIGVTHYDEKTGKYMARCCNVMTGKQVTVGRYPSELLAHKAWLAFKLKQAEFLAERQTDPRVAEALVSRYRNYEITS